MLTFKCESVSYKNVKEVPRIWQILGTYVAQDIHWKWLVTEICLCLQKQEPELSNAPCSHMPHCHAWYVYICFSRRLRQASLQQTLALGCNLAKHSQIIEVDCAAIFLHPLGDFWGKNRSRITIREIPAFLFSRQQTELVYSKNISLLLTWKKKILGSSSERESL
jgi:hypothetical protein